MKPNFKEPIVTLADWAKRLDPDSKVANLLFLLEERNEVLKEMLWIEKVIEAKQKGLPTFPLHWTKPLKRHHR